jgi:3-isopropylmalate dehydrogenase
MTYKILLLPGDGIGPEVIAEVERILAWYGKNRGLSFTTDTALVGGAALDKEGTPVTEATMQLALDSDAVLFGAVGGPKWDNNSFDKKPERALLRLRKELGLFANLRPAICFDALTDASSLRPEIVAGLDILIVRELTGGVYFGEPKEITTLPNGERRAVDSQVYTTSEIQRIARVAFDLARLRKNQVASAEKSNVMVSGVLWREEVTKVHKAEYADVQLSHILADNCAMQLVRNPKQFDVIVTDNLFGDMLSDEAAQAAGSIGMLPSASLGAKDTNGKQKALYEPVHGSAPDIAGKGLANPLACILSLAMCLRYSFARVDDAVLLEKAVEKVLNDGLRTGDIMQPGKTKVGTKAMGDAVLAALETIPSTTSGDTRSV